MSKLVICPTAPSCTGICPHKIPHEVIGGCNIVEGDLCPACIPYEEMKGKDMCKDTPVPHLNKDGRYNSTLGSNH